MKINNHNYNLSFKKTLVANTAYIKEDKVCPAKIYQLNYAEDKDYFSSLNKDEKWFYSDYLDFSMKNFKHITKFLKFTENPCIHVTQIHH